MLTILLSVLILLLVAFMVGSAILNPEGKHESWVSVPLRIVSGLVVLALCFMLVRGLGLNTGWITLPIASLSIVSVVRKSWRFNVPPAPSVLEQIALPIGLALFVGPTFIQAVLMGTGSYPSVFFNVDTPFHLGLVHALVQANSFPPPYLPNVDMTLAYHYGAQSLAAVVSVFSDLPAHSAFLLLIIPLGLVLQFIVVVGLVSGSSMPTAMRIAIPALILFGTEHAITPVVRHGAPLFDTLLTGGGGFPQVASIYGLLLAFGTTLALVRSTRASSRRAALLFVSAVVLFKLPYAPYLGMGYAAWSLWWSWNSQSYRSMLYPVVAVVLQAILFTQFAGLDIAESESGTKVVFAYFGIFRSGGTWNYLFSALLLIPILIFTFRPAATVRSQKVIGLFLFASALPFILFFVAVKNHNVSQLAKLLPSILAVAVGYSALFPTVAVGARRTVAIVLLAAVLSLPNMVNRVRYANVLLTTPERGHEFVSNEAVAKHLRVIPVSGSIVAIDDLSYPAKDGLRPDLQFQISALFGHQVYLSDFTYVPKSFVESRQDDPLLLSLQSNPLDRCRVANLARSEGVTHILLHRDLAPAEICGFRLSMRGGGYFSYERGNL